MNTYTQKEKDFIVNQYIHGTSVSTLSINNNISRTTIYSWIDKYNKSNKKWAKINFRYLHDLEQTCSRQKNIINILQQSPCSANAPLLNRYDVITAFSDEYNINTLCLALKVSKGSYYNHILRNKNENTLAAQKRKQLEPIIEQIFNDNHQILGSSKIYAILKSRGYSISEDTVAKIMHEKGLFSIRKCSKTLYYQQLERKKNILQQQFKVSRPNEVWVSDITEINVLHKTYFICAILDLYARKIISYKISKSNSTQLTKATFKLAYESRKPTNGLLFHSDQGSNYTSVEFRRYLKSFGIIQSFSKPGTPYDNSVMESFFANFKREELYRYHYKTEKEFFKSVQDYMNYYNEVRPHSTNMYRTPNKFEENYFKRHEEETSPITEQ